MDTRKYCTHSKIKTKKAPGSLPPHFVCQGGVQQAGPLVLNKGSVDVRRRRASRRTLSSLAGKVGKSPLSTPPPPLIPPPVAHVRLDYTTVLSYNAMHGHMSRGKASSHITALPRCFFLVFVLICVQYFLVSIPLAYPFTTYGCGIFNMRTNVSAYPTHGGGRGGEGVRHNKQTSLHKS